MAKFSGVKSDVVSAMNLPQFSAEFNVPSLAQNLEIAVRHKVVKPFDVNTMMWRRPEGSIRNLSSVGKISGHQPEDQHAEHID